jgi:hypothetical protein
MTADLPVLPASESNGILATAPRESALPSERPRRAQARLAAGFVNAVMRDFETHGAGTVATLRSESPANYLRLVASLLPKELPDEDPLDELSDDELRESIRTLRALSAEARARSLREAQGSADGEPAAGLSSIC